MRGINGEVAEVGNTGVDAQDTVVARRHLPPCSLERLQVQKSEVSEGIRIIASPCNLLKIGDCRKYVKRRGRFRRIPRGRLSYVDHYRRWGRKRAHQLWGRQKAGRRKPGDANGAREPEKQKNGGAPQNRRNTFEVVIFSGG